MDLPIRPFQWACRSDCPSVCYSPHRIRLVFVDADCFDEWACRSACHNGLADPTVPPSAIRPTESVWLGTLFSEAVFGVELGFFVRGIDAEEDLVTDLHRGDI